MSSSKFSSYDPVNKIWRGPARPSVYNPDVGLGYIILNVLKQNPDRVMQICDHSDVEMTCNEMHSRTVKIASFLVSSTDLKQGDVVTIFARNSENIAPVAFACFTLGLPINAIALAFGVSEIVEMFLKTHPKAIFCDFDTIDKVKVALKKVELYECKVFTLMGKVEGYEFFDEILERFEGKVDEFEPPILPNISSTPLAILCSSGTSGSSKGIARSNRSWIYSLSFPWCEPYGQDCACFYSTTLHWNTSFQLLLKSALFNVTRVVTTKDMDIDSYLDLLKRRKITSTFIAPYISDKIMKSGRKDVIESVKNVMIGGASVQGMKFDKLQKMFPNAELVSAYGCSEVDVMTMGEATHKPGSCGRLLDNLEVKIIDDSGNHLGPNEKGQICFKSPVMFDSYINDPEGTKQAFDAEGWCYTGDVGYFDDDGDIFVVDRVKHMLKYNHIIITPHDVESVINEITGVISSCVVGVYDKGNDIIFAFVIKDESKVELSEGFIENYVNERVIDAKKIRGGVHFVKEFPMTPTGKVKSRELREMAEKIYKEQKGAF